MTLSEALMNKRVEFNGQIGTVRGGYSSSTGGYLIIEMLNGTLRTVSLVNEIRIVEG